MSTLYYFCKVYSMRAMADEVRDLQKKFRVFIAIALKYVSGNIHYRALLMNAFYISQLKFKSREMCKRNMYYGSDRREPLR